MASVEMASVGLRQENAALQQLQAVDRESQAGLRDRIANLSLQNAELKRRLALLRGVLLPDGQAPELGVADLRLIPQADGAGFEYRLLLAQAAPLAPRTDLKLSGRVQLWVTGRIRDQQRDIRLAEPRLALQRLQALSGVVVLPSGFQPLRVRVVLEPTGHVPLPFEFSWQDSVVGGDPLKTTTPLP